MATITDTTTDANGNIIVNVSSSADDAITLATAGTYSDKNIIFNLTTPAETDPTVPAWAKAVNKPSYTASEVGLGNVDNVKQYSASNPPPYPVTSVNGQTGDVTVESGAKPNTVKVTLTASGWDSTANTQTVTATGVLADETSQLIQPVPAIASQAAYYEAGILCTGQAANSLTFTATTIPTSNLNVYVIIQDILPPQISFTVMDTIYQIDKDMTWGQWVNSAYNTSIAPIPFEEYIREYNKSFTYSDNDVVSSNYLYSDVKGVTHVLRNGIFARPDGRGLSASGLSFYKDGTLLRHEQGPEYNTNSDFFIVDEASTIVSLTDTIIAGQKYTQQYL